MSRTYHFDLALLEVNPHFEQALMNFMISHKNQELDVLYSTILFREISRIYKELLSFNSRNQITPRREPLESFALMYLVERQNG